VQPIQRFSADQEAVRALGTDGRYLVSGPPGTGKSVLAALRVARLELQAKAESGRRGAMLITNYRLLTEHIIQGIGPALSSLDKSAADAVGYMNRSQIVSTFQSWIRKTFWRDVQLEMVKAGVPAQDIPIRKDAAPGAEPFSQDWTEIGRILAKLGIDDAPTIMNYHLVIDEGQDLPEAFYRFLQQIDANVTVFADENQRLFDNNSTLDVIRDCLGIDRTEGAQEFRVSQNFRNTKPVAEFASQFYVGLDTGRPELPVRTGERPQFVGFDAEDGIARQIVKLVRPASSSGPRRPKSVGVIVFDHSDLMKWLKLLSEAAREVNSAVEVRCYNSKDAFAAKSYNQHPWSPDKPGTITLVTVYTMKGLEWDDVIILPSRSNATEETLIRQMQVYVAASRPRGGLYICFVAPADASPANEAGSHLGQLFSRFTTDPALMPLVRRYYTPRVQERVAGSER
jgi:DNA helicase IV